MKSYPCGYSTLRAPSARRGKRKAEGIEAPVFAFGYAMARKGKKTEGRREEKCTRLRHMASKSTEGLVVMVTA